jgi:hypothetical protein
MCLAGDGGGKGSRRKRLAGVAGAGDAAAEEPKRWCAGLGLGVENGKKGDDAQCCVFFVGVAAAGDLPPGPGGGGVAGGEWSASCVSGFAWHPPIVRARGIWRTRLRRSLLGGWGGHGGEREREWRVGTGWLRGSVSRIETGKVGEE